MSVLKLVLGRLLVPIERAVTAVLYPVCRFGEFLSGTVRVPILVYHQVGPPLEGGPHRADCVSPRRFERQMRAVLDAGYRVVALPDLVRALESGRLEDLRHSVVLTFDDGYRGQFVFAWPVLQRLRLPSTFFVTTGLVGKSAFDPHLAIPPARGGASPPLSWLPLSWDEVEEMERHGIDMRLQEALGGSAYRGACTRAIGRSGADSDPLALPRIPMEEGDGPFRVRCKLAGAYDWVGPFASLWERLTERGEPGRAAIPLDARAPRAGR